MAEFNDRSIFCSGSLRQPKRELADFVEQMGIPVPKRYSSLEEALSTLKPFVVRSEHPADVKGGSGILDSLFVSWQSMARCTSLFLFDTIDWDYYFKHQAFSGKKPDMTGKILARIRSMKQEELEKHLTTLSNWEIETYCAYSGLNVEEFTSQITYSYWEMLPGLNRTIMADNSLEDRYHIFSAEHVAPQGFPLSSNFNYFVFEKGEVVKGRVFCRSEDSKDSINSLIQIYESIRGSKTDCPVMELQSARNTHYFLQYHQGLDFKASAFKLERGSRETEIEALLVRGSTPPEGTNYRLRLCYIPEHPPASLAVLDWVPNYLNGEAVAQNRKLQIIGESKGFYTSDNRHAPRSRLIKPLISAVFLYKELSEFHKGIDYSFENPNPEMDIHFISDGRKAYMSRI